MEDPKKTEQMDEVAGGDYGPVLELRPAGSCIQCGREEDAVYLYAHGGLCKRCAEAKPIQVCPDCGGKLRPAPGLYPVGEVEFECADCGKKVKL